MANGSSTTAELWRAYLREHIAHSERFNRVYRGRSLAQHMQAHAARRKCRNVPKPRGKAWRRVWAQSRARPGAREGESTES
ncbi:TPA: hypothetical protein ACITN2_004362 [Salmonella enterica subsp. enterica serovar Virchow]